MKQLTFFLTPDNFTDSENLFWQSLELPVCLYPFCREGGIHHFWGSQGFKYVKHIYNKLGGESEDATC